MVFQFVILSVVIYFSPLVPPVLPPLAYSLTGALLIQWGSPRILSIISVGVATLSTATIRVVQNHIIEKLNTYEETSSKSRFHHQVGRLNRFFKRQESLAKISAKREKYIETKAGKAITFGFAIFCFLPVLPDIIGTRILYKKIKFMPFIIAVFIGKSVTHIPFIFLWKGILQLLHIVK